MTHKITENQFYEYRIENLEDLSEYQLWFRYLNSNKEYFNENEDKFTLTKQEMIEKIIDNDDDLDMFGDIK